MPTLLEKSSPPAPLPTQVLQSRHNWERWSGTLFTLLAGLVGTFATLFAIHPGNLRGLVAIWLGGIFLTLCAAVVAWRLAPASLSNTAQGIDRNLSAKNRLETVAALNDSSSPLAKAQRDETADYLKQTPQARPVRALPWLIGSVLALALIHFILFAVWVVPTLFHGTPSVSKPTPPKEIPHATIVWKSPEPESKANPIEEVPTVAVAQSTSGLKDLSLEISVNGVAKKSQPLPAKPYDTAGKNEIKVSIYMDELGVEPYDTVSYFIRGQRIWDQKLPETVSAIQFIQVRPFRDDVRQGLPGTPGKSFDLLIKLKLAQLKSVKENFILAHTDLAVTDPIRVKENERVGKNQADLATKVDEVVQVFIQEGVPPEIVDLLNQAEPPMNDAAKKILATQNNEALPSQEKALSLIIAIEKYFIKVMPPPTPAAGAPDDSPEDPFKDKQQHELKKRPDTMAGQLEQLAKNQSKLAKDVGSDPSSNPSSTPPTLGNSGNGNPDKDGSKPEPRSSAGGQGTPSPTPGGKPGDSDKPAPKTTPQAGDPFGPDADKGTLAERQARILQGVEALLGTNDTLPPSVNQSLQEAKKHATESTHQLDQGNDAAAKEPAAAAAQDLQHAVTEMNKAGEAAAKQAMEDAQKQLNDAARELTDAAKENAPGSKPQELSDVALKVQDIQKQTAKAADQQQQTGSAEAAQRLADLANQISGEHIAKDLGTMATKGLDANQAAIVAQKLEDLANQAAHGVAPGKPSAQEVARLVNALEASRANLARLAEKAGGSPSDHGNTPHQAPGNDQGKGQGDQPGKDQGKDQGKGEGKGHGDQPGKDESQNQGQGEGKGQGGQPGKDESNNPSPDQGKEPGDKPGKDEGKGQGQGDGKGQGNQPGGQPGSNGAAGNGPGGTAPGGMGNSGSGGVATNDIKAYNDTLANMQDQVQQASVVVPHADVQDLQKQLDAARSTGYQNAKPVNVVQGYQALAAPLDKLIQDLTSLIAQAQRQDLIKQSNPDEAPPSYRPAVSDYFENMSRDYHPDKADTDTKKP